MVTSISSGSNGAEGASLAATPSQVASTSAITLDAPENASAPVKAEETNNEDAQLFASLVSGMQDGAAAATIAAAAASSGLIPSLPMLDSLAPPKQEHDEPAAPIQAYAKLEFPGFSYYIQTLDFTIGRRPAEFRAKTADEQHITGRSKLAGDVDVDLGPLKSISRFHVRIFYQDQSPTTWNGTGTNGVPTSQAAMSPPFGHARSASVSSSGRGSSYDIGDHRASRKSSHGRFVLQVLGRNGACVDDVYVGMGAIVPLGKRTKIQIAERVFYFVLPPAHSHMMDTTTMRAYEDDEMGSEVSLGSSDEDESDDEDDTSGTATDVQGKQPLRRKKATLKPRSADLGKAGASADSVTVGGDESKASIANRKRKRGEPLDEDESKALKVGTPIGVEALNLNKKKKNDATSASSDAAVPTPARAPTGMAAIAIAALAAKDAADAAKSKGIKAPAGAIATPPKGNLGSMTASATSTPMSEMPLPPAGPGIKPDKADLDLVREAMSSPMAVSRGGKLTLHEIYDYLMETYEYFKNNGRFNGRDWHSGIRTAISRAPIMVRIDRKPEEPGYGVFYAFGTSEAAIAARAERGQPLDAPGEISRSPSPPFYPFSFPMPLTGGPPPGSIPYMPSHMHGLIPGLMPPMGMSPMTQTPGNVPMPMMPGAMNVGLGMPMGASMSPVPTIPPTVPTSKASPMPAQSAASTGTPQTRARPPPPSTPKTSAITKTSNTSIVTSPTPATGSAKASSAPRSAASSPAIAADGRVRIVVGKAPPEALAQMASAPKAAITQSIEALFGGPPIVHHEGTLFLSPVVFGKMSAQEINDIGGKGAQQALATLQAQLVAHLQSKMAAGLDPAQSSPSPGPSDGATARPVGRPAGRPPLANSVGRPSQPSGTIAARPALGRPSITGSNAGRPTAQPKTEGTARPSSASATGTTGVAARPIQVGRPAVNRPPLGSNVPRPIGAGLSRPVRPPLQRPPSASIARPGVVSSSAASSNATSAASVGSVVRPVNGSTLSTAARPTTTPSPATSTTTTQRSAGRPLARPTLSRPPLNTQRPMNHAPARPAPARPPLSARPRAAAPPGLQSGRPATVTGKVSPSATVARPSVAAPSSSSAAVVLSDSSRGPAASATSTTATATASKTAGSSAAPPTSSTASSSSSADMAGLLALLAGGKLDSSKLTPAQHELLQRAGRLAAEQQQRAQQQKAAAAAAAAASSKAANETSTDSQSKGHTDALSTEKVTDQSSSATKPST